MGVPLNRIKPQDFAGQECIPLLFFPLNALALTDPDQPGLMQPFRADLDGNLLVSIGGTAGPILLRDDSDAIAEVATNSRVPTVARLFALNRATGSDYDRIRTDDDGVESSAADSLPALAVMGRNRLYQNTNDAWEREKANGTVTVFASAARTATVISANILNVNWRTSHWIINVTAIAATPSVVFNIEARDATSLVWYPLLQSPAIVATGTTVLKIGSGFTPVPNLTANNMLPFILRVNAVHADADSITYSVGANFGV